MIRTTTSFLNSLTQEKCTGDAEVRTLCIKLLLAATSALYFSLRTDVGVSRARELPELVCPSSERRHCTDSLDAGV
jgi:hypothetical protein